MDQADRTLLRLLQESSRKSLDDLAQSANLSKSAVQRRLQKLRDEKVILDEITIVDPKQVGPSVTMLVEIEFERDRPEFMALFQRWIANEIHVQQAWCITGRGDYTLVVMTDSIEGFEVFMERLLNKNRYVRKFTTCVVLRTIKRGLTVPM